jgi:uncharacterized membrane protein
MASPDGGHGNAAVRVVRRIERSGSLDRLDATLRPVARLIVREPRRAALLRGTWLGHAIHPLMTDFPLGMWLSGTVLDLVGGSAGRPAARRLIGLGVLASLPTAATGVVEWEGITAQRDRRTGALHAVVNTAALACYVGSWLARRRGRSGTALALAGGVVATAGGYLGGHLTEVRKVSSHHPAFDAPARPL